MNFIPFSATLQQTIPWCFFFFYVFPFFDNAALFPWQIRDGDADANNVGAVEEDDEEEEDEQAATDKESGGSGSKGEKGEEEEDGK